MVKPKTAFFLFWVLFFVVSHLWNFRTAPWNGNALFDESGWDLWYLKNFVIGHPYQPAWFHFPISRETLFHYYVWGFLKLFGFNILSYQAALFVIWLTIFVFTLLLVDLFFESYLVTSVTALILNFLPFAFIYTFAGYRYPMATALAVVSLYFLHLGFRTASRFYLSLGGIAAGLCLASSISGKQYLLALVDCCAAVCCFLLEALKRRSYMEFARRGRLWLSWRLPRRFCFISCLIAKPTLTTNPAFFAISGSPAISVRFRVVFNLTSSNVGLVFSRCRPSAFLFQIRLPIPLPYYWLLVPGLVLALWQKRFEIPLLATIPVVGAFIAKCIENRLLMPIPFWVILMSFTAAGILKLRRWPGVQIVLGVVAALILLDGLVPSVRYIYGKTKSPFSIHHYAQQEVAVSRFLKHVVAGEEHPGPPHLERNEFNRIHGLPGSRLTTRSSVQNDAYSIIHLFLHDYDDDKILSFCSGLPFFWVMTEQDVWNANKRAILTYAPS